MMLLLAVTGMMLWPGEISLPVMLVSSALGAFLAALPGRIRRRREQRLRSTWQGCAVCFAAGFLMVLAASLGRMQGQLAIGLMQGSIAAWAFAGIAWLAGCIAARLRERRHAS